MHNLVCWHVCPVLFNQCASCAAAQIKKISNRKWQQVADLQSLCCSQDPARLQSNIAALMACNNYLYQAVQGIPNRMTVS